MTGSERHLVTIGHSYVVAENRRLAHEMAIAGRGRWRVTAVAPSTYRGDLRRIALETIPNEASAVVRVAVGLDRSPHFMFYRGLADALATGPDLVHCWEEPFVFSGAQVARRAPARARVVFATFQNLPKDYPWPLSRFERDSLHRASGWVAFGRTVEEVLTPRALYAAKPHRVIPPGVDVARFRPDAAAGAGIRRDLGWPEDAHVIGYLGRFEPQKGIADLCDALDQMRSPWRALFVGGGTLETSLRHFAASHPGRVQIATGVPHGDVPRWLNAMTVLCAPSLTTAIWREQFGRMLIEAMACGVPVVASDSGEMPYVVGDAGRVLREGDRTAWAAALDALAGDWAALADLAQRGVARAHAVFSWPVVARQHLAFFDALMQEPHAA